jgi:hypothetical protein
MTVATAAAAVKRGSRRGIAEELHLSVKSL